MRLDDRLAAARVPDRLPELFRAVLWPLVSWPLLLWPLLLSCEVLCLLDPRPDAFELWLRVLPRVDWRLLLLADLLDAPRLLERLEEPRPLATDMSNLLLFGLPPARSVTNFGSSSVRRYPKLRTMQACVDECSTR